MPIVAALLAGVASFAAANSMPFSGSPFTPRSTAQQVRADCDEWGQCFSLPERDVQNTVRDADRRYRNDGYFHPSRWDDHQYHGHHGYHEHHEHGGGHHHRHGHHRGEHDDY